jgi:signal transduction histidine kinase
VVTVHPHTLVQGEVFTNFYYIPSSDLHSKKLDSQTLRKKVWNLEHRRRMMEELKQAKEDAIAASEAKTQFLITVSHEIRTPLNGILGMTEALLQHSSLGKDKELLEIINASGAHLLTVINDVLESSRIESGSVELEDEAFDLFSCVRDAINICKPHACRKGLKISDSFQDICPQWIRGDVTRLRQVLVNLVGNSIKFTEKGTVCVRVECELAPERGPEGILLTISVSDPGIGIPSNRLHAIFTGFTQANQSTTRLYGGTGLGLSISKQIVELWDGNISVESQEGVGTTFTFTLPTRVHKAPYESDDLTPVPKRQKVGHYNILVAEDNLTNQKVVERMLVSLGCSFKIVSDGQEAVEAVSKQRFDAILMDLFMPVLDGWDAAKVIRENEGAKCPKIVALTASMLREVDKKKNSALFDSVLIKPLSLQTLKTKLESLLS